ncbi:MAG: hypothetical protein KJ571_12350 [Bacteroidetes bacterium]|nr:hypothetical protein [Bacteroidota bacterium]
MRKIIGIRREDKNIWERRVPLIPEHVKILKEKSGVESIVQPFPRRAFSDEEFINAGAVINEDMSDCQVIIAVKEIPIKLLQPDKTYLFFSHTIKAQEYNMPLLKKIIDLRCTLIDYECITDEKGRRLVFFGRFAGLAGMIETFYGLGQRLKNMGYDTPLLKVKQAYEYEHVEDAENHLKEIAEEIKNIGMPEIIAPFVFGFAGYGNVSKGAQQIFNILPFKEISPEELLMLNGKENKIFYKVIFKEEDLAKPINNSDQFELSDYYKHPEKYTSKFEKYLDKIDVLVNCIYWDDRYPRLVTKKYLSSAPDKKVKLICDISCDIDGSIEITHKVTVPDMPAFVYNPKDDSYTNGFAGEGIVNIAIDNLPTELPVDSSKAFSDALSPFIPGIINADLNKSFDENDFPDEIKRAVIVYKGELTPEFKYLEEYLPS